MMEKTSVFLLPASHVPENNAGTIPQNLLRDFTGSVATHFNMPSAVPTNNGRGAMDILFRKLELKREDEVFITTTFDYPNVSSCVTCTVFNYCKPSRVLSAQCKAIFIIHEFGVMHPRTSELAEWGKNNGIPVIEDCAHTVYSMNEEGIQCGRTGDWVIVTLPKIFPVFTGGFLAGREKIDVQNEVADNVLHDMHVAAMLWSRIPAIAARRRELSTLYRSLIDVNKARPLINSYENTMPWFFPVRVKNASAMIAHLRTYGIECGHWHGSDVVVIPLHQELTEQHVEYVSSRVNSFDFATI